MDNKKHTSFSNMFDHFSIMEGSLISVIFFWSRLLMVMWRVIGSRRVILGHVVRNMISMIYRISLCISPMIQFRRNHNVMGSMKQGIRYLILTFNAILILLILIRNTHLKIKFSTKWKISLVISWRHPLAISIPRKNHLISNFLEWIFWLIINLNLIS